jgi:hypothetical protein
MMLSIHDNLLISYEVHCENRIILLHTEYRVASKPSEFRGVVFEGVQGYNLKNDAFGNIILDLSSIPVEKFLIEYGTELSESYRMAGSPGSWAANLASAESYLRERAIKGFILSSSYGLSGWILAKSFAIFSVDDRAPASI